MRFALGLFVCVYLVCAGAGPAYAQTPSTAPASAGEAASAAVATTPSASPQALELTRRYFAAMHMETTVGATVMAMMPQMMASFARNNPKMTEADQKAVVEAAAESTQVMIGKMMDKMAPVFATSFTEHELQDLVAFYEGPTGQALVAKTPAFAARMSPMLSELMPEMAADMHARLCARVACVAKPPAAPATPS